MKEQVPHRREITVGVLTEQYRFLLKETMVRGAQLPFIRYD